MNNIYEEGIRELEVQLDTLQKQTSWNEVTHENFNLPKLGERVILCKNGVVHNVSFVLDKTCGTYLDNEGDYFWHRTNRTLDEDPLVEIGDKWMHWPKD